jgi:hypothetical protein
LRKYLIVAVAAFTAIAIASVASAQGTDTATLKVSVSPKDAGTKSKPKNTRFNLEVVNSNTSRTMSDLDIFMPKNVTLSLKGIPSCAPNVIALNDCPSSTVLGRGEAHALAGVNGSAPLPLEFVVTAYKTKSAVNGKDMLGFYIDGPGELNFLTETQLKKASGKFGQRLHIDVPDAAQRTGATSYNGLVSLKIENLGKKKGNNYLVSSTGCKNKKHPYKVDLTFIDNTVTPAGKISKSANAKCAK